MAVCLVNEGATSYKKGFYSAEKYRQRISLSFSVTPIKKLRIGISFIQNWKTLFFCFLVILLVSLDNFVSAFSFSSQYGKQSKKPLLSHVPKQRVQNTLSLTTLKLDTEKNSRVGIDEGFNESDSTYYKVNIDGNATDFAISEKLLNSTKNGKQASLENGEMPPLKNGKGARSTRSLWRRRHARSITEGIRRERSTPKKLSSLLQKARQDTLDANRQFLRSAITGFISAVAEKSEGLSVKVKTRKGTPFWEKHIDFVEVVFSRLEFRPIRIGGIGTGRINELNDGTSISRETLPSNKKASDDLNTTDVDCMIEAFQRIDSDNSGTLDRDEIAEALDIVTFSNSDGNLLAELAAELVDLYDANGDGVVDFDEYKLMVEHMADLRDTQQKRSEDEAKPVKEETPKRKWFGFRNGDSTEDFREMQVVNGTAISDNDSMIEADAMAPVKSSTGAITITDLKLDLRRLIFGAVPVVKKITPGGPLVLEPFTANVKGSFNDQDVLQSFLVNKGLRLLAARAIRRRVRSFRDITDGAFFFGRSWNMASVQAPVVEVPQITQVEFDKRNRLIVTGRAKVRTSPEAPEIEQAFKLRTKLGTRKNGQAIRLEQPELALVIECPRAWERNIVTTCRKFNLTTPTKPDPLYSFFPIYSPFKLEDDDGFDMGPDNRLRALEIKDGAFHFEMQAILRPGRFLGSHYVAFTLPMRTFLITLERVVGAIRTARKNKNEAKTAAKLDLKKKEANGKDGLMATEAKAFEGVENSQDLSFTDTPKESYKNTNVQPRPQKSFFSRFIEGYQDAGKEDEVQSERLTIAISEWFGRQGRNNGNE